MPPVAEGIGCSATGGSTSMTCGPCGGSMVLGGVLFARSVTVEGLSFRAVMHLIFNLGFYGCIAAAIGYAIAGKWKKAGLSVLVLVAFIVLYWLFGVSILHVLSRYYGTY